MSRDPPAVVASVAAGWDRNNDLLAKYTRGKPKALILIAGKPMISYVVDALGKSRYVEQIIIVGLDPTVDVELESSLPVDYVPDAGDILSNNEAGIQRALERHPDLDAILLSGSDIPTITPPIVDALIEECFRTEHELYYPIIERSVMEEHFPGSGRSYVHLQEGEFAGGDMMLVRPSLNFSHRELLKKLSQARKSPLRQARMLGLGTLLKLITHRLSINEAERRAHKALDVHVRVIPFPYAEVGMDVDKPFQLEIVRAALEARNLKGSQG